MTLVTLWQYFVLLGQRALEYKAVEPHTFNIMLRGIPGNQSGGGGLPTALSHFLSSMDWLFPDFCFYVKRVFKCWGVIPWLWSRRAPGDVRGLTLLGDQEGLLQSFPLPLPHLFLPHPGSDFTVIFSLGAAPA